MALPAVVRIDQYWDIESRSEDLARFRAQDVELLLDQAADLLDRILRDQAAFDDLGEKLFEIEALKAEMAAREGLVSVALPHTEDPPFGIANGSIVMANMPGEATGEEYSAYFDELAPLHIQSVNLANLRRPYQDVASRNRWMESSGFAAAGTNDPADSRYQGAKQVREQEMGVSDEQFAANQVGAIAMQKSVLKRARALAIRHAFEVESTKLNNRLKKMKSDAASEPKHGLNFVERRQALQSRINNDFSEVKARVFKAAEGLKLIYKYNDDLPLKDTNLGIYDRYLISVRRAISYLVGITRRDQQFAITISLKQLL
jgi:hypothetical protein